jgi:hypothetical protein
VVGDVQQLRNYGWRDVTLDDVHSLLAGGSKTGRFFHVTSDDGEAGDGAFVRALQTISCPCTLFLSLETMNEEARRIHLPFVSSKDIRMEDHSLSHQRAFHYRHVIGFHSDLVPLMSSAHRMGLSEGSPVCIYGGEFACPNFLPHFEAMIFCKSEAQNIREKAGSREWSDQLRRKLIASGFGFLRFGKLCIQGKYESVPDFQIRIQNSLKNGFDHLAKYLGRQPVAFAYPWWEGSSEADSVLKQLGYQMTFSGLGICHERNLFGIPRIFINNETPRPLNFDLIKRSQSQSHWEQFKRFGRRLFYA